MKWIGVVDCNNFFVSCERLFRPDLQHKPVAVLSSNDGCIVARSQEVKDMDIPMGVPYFKVKDILKDSDTALFSSHFALYRNISGRIMKQLHTLLETVEEYSIDEAFFTLETDDPRAELQRIKYTIEMNIGIPVSIGVASSKTKAKYAVGVAKKTNGVHVLENDNWRQQAEAIKLGSLWGVGGRSRASYEKAGYVSVADLLAADPARIKRLFGVTGERLRAELGDGCAYLVERVDKDRQSLVSSRTFSQTTENKAVLEDAAAYHTRHIATDLRRRGLEAMAIRLSIQAGKHSDFVLQGGAKEAVLDVPSNNTFVLLPVVQELLCDLYRIGVPYKKVGVSVGQLRPEACAQTAIWSDAVEERSAEIVSVIDQLNTKEGRELITIGDRKKGGEWHAKRDQISPAYVTKWTDVALVKA